MNIENLLDDDRLTAAKPFRTFLHIYRGYISKIVMSILFYQFQKLPVYLLPIFTANVINIATAPKAHPLSELWWNFLFMSIILLQNIPASVFSVKFMSKVLRSVEAGLRGTLITKLQQLSIGFHGELKSGKLQSKVLRDVEAIENMSKQIMTSLIPAIFNIVIAIAITVSYSLTVSLFFVLLIPVAVSIIFIFRKRINSTNREFRNEIEAMAGQVSEMVDMIPVTRAHGLSDIEVSKVGVTLRNIRDKGYKLDMIVAFFDASNWVSFQIFQLLCLVFTVFLAYKGQITVGEVVLYQGFFNMILSSVTSFLNIYPNITKGMESLHSVTEVLLSKDTEENKGRHKLEAIQGLVSFQNVDFQYRNSEQHVLRNLSFEVKVGECIAFVGESGAGKSTILNLLIGFYKPTQGRILIDGIAMDEIDMQGYRSSLAVVLQSNILFSGSIRDNIAYGLPLVSEAELQRVIDIANLRDVIDNLPDGLDTMLGEHGGKLSGGQRQRIAIARALIRNPKIIILDEATSALDNISERHVQTAMQRLIQGRTTFIVAHRLSTIRDADTIVVMKKGEIVEKGSYEQLMKQHGELYRLNEHSGNH